MLTKTRGSPQHPSTKMTARLGEWWLSVQNVYPRCATIFLWDHKHMTLSPVSKEHMEREYYKDKGFEANKEP